MLQVKVISSTDREHFESELNIVLKELSEQDKPVKDVKYRSTLYDRNGWYQVFDALIIYDELAYTEEDRDR